LLRTEGENDATKRVKTEILVQMQGVGHDLDGVLVLAATNIPWSLDPAIRRRQGFRVAHCLIRFEKRIYIPLPDRAGREALFSNKLKDIECTFDMAKVKEFAGLTEG